MTFSSDFASHGLPTHAWEDARRLAQERSPHQRELLAAFTQIYNHTPHAGCGLALPRSLYTSSSALELACGYLASSFLLLVAAGVEAVCGVKAERQGLENLAPPLSVVETY